MIFIETSIFTEAIQRLLPDEPYRHLQLALMVRPEAGDLIRGSGGLRKVRWNIPAGGKRGGLRVVYYWDPPGTIYMLLAYRKSRQEDLTPEQLKVLRGVVKEWLK